MSGQKFIAHDARADTAIKRLVRVLRIIEIIFIDCLILIERLDTLVEMLVTVLEITVYLLEGFIICYIWYL